jgi:hypothetical protein
LVDGVEGLERLPSVRVGHRVIGEPGLTVEVGETGDGTGVGSDQVTADVPARARPVTLEN